jgi:hypothetical protein
MRRHPSTDPMWWSILMVILLILFVPISGMVLVTP